MATPRRRTQTSHKSEEDGVTIWVLPLEGQIIWSSPLPIHPFTQSTFRKLGVTMNNSRRFLLSLSFALILSFSVALYPHQLHPLLYPTTRHVNGKTDSNLYRRERKMDYMGFDGIDCFDL